MNIKQTSMNGYVARNGTGKLMFFTRKPERYSEKSLLSDKELKEQGLSRVNHPKRWVLHDYSGSEVSFNYFSFDESIFKNLKWEDEPVKVRLSVEIIN